MSREMQNLENELSLDAQLMEIEKKKYKQLVKDIYDWVFLKAGVGTMTTSNKSPQHFCISCTRSKRGNHQKDCPWPELFKILEKAKRAR